MDDTKKTQDQSYLGDDSILDDALEESVVDDPQDYTEEKKSKGQQGFASMPKDRQREIASKGGRAAHQQGTAHEWDSEEAREAGRRGGQSKRSQQEEEVLEEEEAA